jgi:hypothetical protein
MPANALPLDMMGNFNLENHKKWRQNREAMETALHGRARQERMLRLQSTPHSSPCSESRMPASKTRRISELSDLNATAVNEQRGASSLEVDWQHLSERMRALRQQSFLQRRRSRQRHQTRQTKTTALPLADVISPESLCISVMG